jgi:hypothetical protein
LPRGCALADWLNRLQSSKDEWLTHDIYSAFIKGVEQADAALG